MASSVICYCGELIDNNGLFLLFILVNCHPRAESALSIAVSPVPLVLHISSCVKVSQGDLRRREGVR